jgi:hypothetical protein
MAAASYKPAPAGHTLESVKRTPLDNGSHMIQRTTWKRETSYSAWPEDDSTNLSFTCVYTNLYFMTIDVTLYTRKVVTVKLTGQEDTYKEAAALLTTWLQTEPYKGYLLQEEGTGITTLGRNRHLAVATFISAWSGWSLSRAAGAGMGGP